LWFVKSSCLYFDVHILAMLFLSFAVSSCNLVKEHEWIRRINRSANVAIEVGPCLFRLTDSRDIGWPPSAINPQSGRPQGNGCAHCAVS
jgi:hypothetical protein